MIYNDLFIKTSLNYFGKIVWDFMNPIWKIMIGTILSTHGGIARMKSNSGLMNSIYDQK